MSAITSPLRVRERVVCLATIGSVSSSAMLWVEVLVGGLRPPRVVCTGLVVVLPSQDGGSYHFFPRFLPFERSE